MTLDDELVRSAEGIVEISPIDALRSGIRQWLLSEGLTIVEPGDRRTLDFA